MFEELIESYPLLNSIILFAVIALIAVIIAIVMKEKDMIVILMLIAVMMLVFFFLGFVVETFEVIAILILSAILFSIFGKGSENVSFFSKMFRFAQFVQFVFFIVFVFENYASLDEIEYVLDFWTVDETITINFYLVIPALIVVYVVALVFGVNVVDTGLTDSAHATFRQIVSLVLMFVLFTLTTSFYLVHLEEIGVIMILFIGITYIFKGIESLRKSEVESE